MKNISIKECLQAAKVILNFPLSPLMNKQNKELTDKYKKALHSIFRTLDSNFDGKLTISDFQNFHLSKVN